MYLVAYEDLEGRMHVRTFSTLDEAGSYAELVGGAVHSAGISEQELSELFYGPGGFPGGAI